jgi:hypothetical protein
VLGEEGGVFGQHHVRRPLLVEQLDRRVG